MAEFEASRIMTQEEYLEQFKKEVDKMVSLTDNKNRDYAGKNDAFANFRMIDTLTQGRISVENGIIVRITDKLARIVNLLQSSANVKTESIADTLQDLAVYSIILKMYIENKLNS